MAPLAVIVAGLPAQVVGDVTATVGEVVTLMLAVVALVHVPVVPITE